MNYPCPVCGGQLAVPFSRHTCEGDPFVDMRIRFAAAALDGLLSGVHDDSEEYQRGRASSRETPPQFWSRLAWQFADEMIEAFKARGNTQRVAEELAPWPTSPPREEPPAETPREPPTRPRGSR
jgi:hypothetical protein